MRPRLQLAATVPIACRVYAKQLVHKREGTDKGLAQKRGAIDKGLAQTRQALTRALHIERGIDKALHDSCSRQHCEPQQLGETSYVLQQTSGDVYLGRLDNSFW